MVEVPATLDDITPDWINATLFDDTPPRVASLSTSLISDGRGFLSQTARVGLTYDSPAGDRPSSVVVKIQPKDDYYRRAEAEVNAFEREIGFYREVAGRVSLRLPRIYFAKTTPRAGALVMEDLGHLTIGDQVRGIAHERVRAVAREIAKVHAAFWNNDALHEIEWAPEHDHFYADPYLEHWPGFADAFGLRIGKRGVAIGEAVAQNLEALERRIAERPASLVHGDLRGDNLLFGQPGGDDEVLILDWQLTHKTLATYDVARLMGGSEPVPERGGHQIDVIRSWHASLTDAGVANYPFDEALDDFRLAALHCLTIPVRIFKGVGPDGEGRRARLLDVTAERFFAAVIELDADSVLPR